MKKTVQQPIRKVYGTTNQQDVHSTAVRKINSLLSSGAVSVTTGPLQPRILKQKTDGQQVQQQLINHRQNQAKCFICNEPCTGSQIFLTQAATATSKTKLPNKIGRIVGDAFMVIVCEDDIICNKCMSLFNQLDRFETDVERIRNNILNSIYKKYGISDDDGSATSTNEHQPNKQQKLNSQTTYYTRKIMTNDEAGSDEVVTRKIPVQTTIKHQIAQRSNPTATVDLVESQLSSMFASNDQPQPLLRVQQPPAKRGPIKIYKCTTCDHKTSDIKQFQAHYETCKAPSNSTTATVQPVATTATTPQLQSGYRCKICKKLFATLQSLKQHNLEKHASITENITIKPADSELKTITQYCCNICKYETTDKRTYDEHLKKHNLKPFKCRVCSMRFEKRDAAQVHARTHQPHYFKCGSCSSSYPNRDLLLKHFETHAAEAQKKQTTQKLLQETIDEALRVDTNETEAANVSSNVQPAGDKPISFFTCDICAVTFLQEVFYNQHMESKHKQLTTASLNSSTASSNGGNQVATSSLLNKSSMGARLNLQTTLINQSQQQQQQQQQQHNSSSLSDADLESIFEKMHSDKPEMDTSGGNAGEQIVRTTSGETAVSNVVITSQENSVGGITFNITIPQGEEHQEHKILQHIQQQQDEIHDQESEQPVSVSIDMPVLETMEDHQQSQEGDIKSELDEQQQQNMPVSMPSLDDESDSQPPTHANTDTVPMDLEDVQNSVDDGQIKYILNNGELLNLNEHIYTDADGNQILVQGTDSEQIQQLLQSVGVLQTSDGMDGETALHMLNENQQMILVQQDGSGEAQLIDASMLTQDSNGQLILQHHHDENSQSTGEDGNQVPLSITFATQPSDAELHEESSQEEQHMTEEIEQQQSEETEQPMEEGEGGGGGGGDETQHHQQEQEEEEGEQMKMETSLELNSEDGSSTQEYLKFLKQRGYGDCKRAKD